MLAPATYIAGVPGGWEIWIILFIVLILFGSRLPKVARSLGQGISEFKKGLAEPQEPDDAKGGGDGDDPGDEPKDEAKPA